MTEDENRNQIAADYAVAFAEHGARHYIGNLDTKVCLYQWGEHNLPVTINDGEVGHSFVCAPYAGYIDYPLEELERFPNPALVPILQAIIRGVGGILSRCDINRVVHINNWMMSTNLPVALDPVLTGRQTDDFVARYPHHFLAMRSLTRRYNAAMMDALVNAGWLLLPSRQIFLIDNITQQMRHRRDTKRDEKLWQNTAFSYEYINEMRDADAVRIVELYDMLYRDKYSQLNPAYTPHFITMTHNIGMIRYMVFRDGDGVIQAFSGMHNFGRHGTLPLLGYNIECDQALGLYRLAFHAGSRYAAEHNLLFNMSSGASAFKRSRGAVAEMEYTAFYLKHLPKARRYPFNLLHWVANHIGIPILRKYQL